MVFVTLAVSSWKQSKSKGQVPPSIGLGKHLDTFNSLTWGRHIRPLTNITVQFGTCLIRICLNVIFSFKFYSTLSKINIGIVDTSCCRPIY